MKIFVLQLSDRRFAGLNTIFAHKIQLN